MANKANLIRALDIKPGKIYLAQYRREWEPCTVTCDSSHGWQRGYVSIVSVRPFPVAEVTFVGTGVKAPVQLSRRGDEYVFSSVGFSTLIEVPKNWALDHMKRVQAEIDKLNARLELLTQVHILTKDES